MVAANPINGGGQSHPPFKWNGPKSIIPYVSPWFLRVFGVNGGCDYNNNPVPRGIPYPNFINYKLGMVTIVDPLIRDWLFLESRMFICSRAMLVRRWCDRIGEIANVGVCRGAAKESVLPACRSRLWEPMIMGNPGNNLNNLTQFHHLRFDDKPSTLGLTIPYSFPCHYQGDTTTAIPVSRPCQGAKEETRRT